MLEIKISKEIRNYTEAVFFGLSLRQCVFGGLGIAAAVIAFLTLKTKLGIEAASWICVVAAAPFAFFGFFKYNGMNAEKFIAAWFRFMLVPNRLLYRSVNLYSGVINKNKVKKIKQGEIKRNENAD